MASTTPYFEWSDAALLTGIADRDPEASAAFYRRYLPSVVAYLMRATADPELTADLTAEVFASVIVGARRYKPMTETSWPWLMGIARNVLSVSRRRGRVEDRVRRRLALEPIELTDADVTETESLAVQGRRSVMTIVETLPDGERDAIKARVVEERPYGEIAANLKCSELVVRKRVSRGLARVRRILEEA